jgi:hypothetical protein
VGRWLGWPLGWVQSGCSCSRVEVEYMLRYSAQGQDVSSRYSGETAMKWAMIGATTPE